MLWTNSYSEPGDSFEYAYAVAVDNDGNVIVTGSSTTIKYSGTGVALWTNRYSGTGRVEDQACDVAVDHDGNVFVTGSSAGDYTTIGYSGAGIPLWTNRYDGTTNSQDKATALIVDGGGGVFVTGYSSNSSGASFDYATVAYSCGGIALWTNHYNGPGNSDDYAAALAVDRYGNVFVTGYMENPVSTNGVHPDYATVAYSAAGVALWTNSYAGSGNSSDRACAVAVDDSGNVVVTGSSAADYVTIKYSGRGVALWTNYYDRSAANAGGINDVSIDDSGNVFVTGYSYGSLTDYDYATIAYSPAGIAFWTNHYNGPGNGDDRASALAVDPSAGTIFVTGYSSTGVDAGYVTIAYSEAGVALWTNRYRGEMAGGDGAKAIAVDHSGNVVVTGSLQRCLVSDYTTIAYSASGVSLWTNHYDGPGGLYDYAAAVTVDGSNNVFVTGYSIGSATSYDYATIAYSPAGVALWTNRYNGPGNSADYANALAVDHNGNVVVTGSSSTVAYSRSGVALWTNRFDGASGVAVDHHGNVFVTGSSFSGRSHDCVTIAYSQTGVPLWTNRYDGPTGGRDGATAIAVDRRGNVFVTGYTPDIFFGGFDHLTIAYAPSGVALWTNSYTDPDNSFDSAYAIAVDKDGNVFVTAYSVGVGSSYNYITIGYSAAGVPLWTNRYNGPANGEDQPGRGSSIAIGRDGAVYVTGSSDSDFGSYSISDYATIKYVWRPHVSIQPLTTSAVNLNVSGPSNSSWAIERALMMGGPWTNLGVSLIGTNGSGTFRDVGPFGRGAFYRAVQP